MSASPQVEIDRVAGRHQGLLRRTVVVSALTLLSRVLGFAREMLSAALFGDRSAVFDAFVTAWRVPNLFRRFLGEGAISTALQTRLTEIDADQGDEAGRRLFWRTMSLVATILAVLSAVVVLGVAFVPDRMPLTGWAWLGEDPEPVRVLTARLFPFVLLVCLSALAGGALYVRGHFALPTLAPVAMNVVWIATLVWIGRRFATGGRGPAESSAQLEMAMALTWGVLLAGLVQLAVHLPALARFGLLFRAPDVPAGPVGGLDRAARDILLRSLPLALGAAVYQINVLVDGFMAEALLPNGGPTVLYFANRVKEFPMALIAVAATSAVFPALKALGHAGRLEELRGLHDRTQLAVAFLALPATAGLLVLADPIATALFRHGSFQTEGAARTADTLRMLAIALFPAGAVGLTSRAYYAVGDFRTPVVVSVWMLGANALLNVVLVAWAGMDAHGLALATALTSWGNLALLAPGLAGRLGKSRSPVAWGGRLTRTALAAASSGAAAGATYALCSARAGNVASLVAAVLAGAVAHVAACAVLGVPELASLSRRVLRR